MVAIAILLLVAIVVIVVWRTIVSEPSTGKEIEAHKRQLGRLGHVVQEASRTSRNARFQGPENWDEEPDGPDTMLVPSIEDEDEDEDEEDTDFENDLELDNRGGVSEQLRDLKYGLPPLVSVASGLAGVVVIVAIIAVILVVMSPSTPSKSGLSTTTSAARSTQGNSSLTVPSIAPATISPISLTASPLSFPVPTGTYKLTIITSQACYVQVSEQLANGKTFSPIGQSLSPGIATVVKVSGVVDLTLGKAGTQVSVNGVALAFPTNKDVGDFVLQPSASG
ncbi:MAG: hypothetical protein HKL80_07225 [Acidimicrobiales bacterium]|nr:hypothetical protein [Acidimicrobiales bacterium]